MDTDLTQANEENKGGGSPQTTGRIRRIGIIAAKKRKRAQNRNGIRPQIALITQMGLESGKAVLQNRLLSAGECLAGE